jgi:hypothetical protein
MRKLLIIFLLFALKSNGQVYQAMTQYGYDVKRMNFDSTLQIPTVCGVPTLKSVVGVKKAAIAFDSCNKRFYFYNPKTLAWDTIKGGGSSTDTTSLSNRINLKLNISDTINKWVGSVTGLNDTTIRVVKDGTTTDIVIRAISTIQNATRLITTVYNKSGATITKGSVIYIDGAHSSVLPSIALAKANTEATSAYTYGLVETDIPNNSQGTVIQNGTITNLNLPTSNYTDGQTLYLSPTIAGGYTTTKPLAPNHYVAIGTITRAHPNFGTIQVAIRNGFQLDEMSDVQIANVPIDSTILQFSRVDSLWHDVNPTTAMGNRFVKTVDSAAMLLPYLRKADSTIFQTKYRSDTARIQTYSSIASKFTLPSLTSGSVLFSDGTTISQNNSNFFWDNSNTRLGIGTVSPGYALDVQGSVSTTAGNIVTFKNTNAALTTSPVLALDCSGTQPDQPVDIRLGSTQPKGLRIYASNADLGASPAGAGFQFFNISSTNFPGQIYFDGGAHNSSSIIFRTAQTSGNITQRMRIFANGNVSVSSSATDAGFLFNVAGTGRFTSALTTAGRLSAFLNRTTTYTLTATDEVVYADATSGAFTVSLPTAGSRGGQTYTIKRANAGANNVTVGTTSSQTIDGSTTYVLSAQYKYVTVVSNGSNWLIISNN